MTTERFTIEKKGGMFYIFDNGNLITVSDGQPICDLLNELHEENQTLQSRNKRLEEKIQRERTSFTKTHERWSREAENKIKELSDENKRLTDKLNQTALELVDGVISQGKAVEISEMSYSEFLDYRAKNGKPMELQL